MACKQQNHDSAVYSPFGKTIQQSFFIKLQPQTTEFYKNLTILDSPFYSMDKVFKNLEGVFMFPMLSSFGSGVNYVDITTIG